MKGRARTVALRAVQALFVAAVVVFIWRYLVHAWPAVHAYRWRFHPLPLVGSAVLFAAYYLLSALVWWAILRGCGLPADRSRSVATWAKSILGRYVPGNVVMFASRGWMSSRQGLDVDRVGAAMVYEQALNVAGALVVTAALLPFWHFQRSAATWALLGIPVIVAAMHPRVFAPLAGAILRALRRPPLARTLPFRWVIAVLAAFAGLWLVAGFAMLTFAAAVTDVTAAAFPQLTAGFALAFVAGMAAFFVPSGIGVREGVLAAATASLFAGGGVALAWALLARLWQTALEIAFVGAAVLADKARRHGPAPAGASDGAPAHTVQPNHGEET